MFVLPHVVHFDSVAHFFELYRTVDLFAISHRMRRLARRRPPDACLGTPSTLFRLRAAQRRSA
jgi:hypothetical protein